MTKTLLALGFAAALSMPLAARADVLQGVLNATGTAVFTQDGITFLDNILFVNGPAGAQQGDFTSLAGTTGTIQNVSTNAPGVTNIPDFITFSAVPNISITLTDLFAGFDGSAGCTAAPAPGQICTPTGTALNFQNTSPVSSSATFSVAGVEYDSATGQNIAVNGLFTLPVAGETYQQLLSTIGTGGTETSSFSAQIFTEGSVNPSPTPEPSTLIFLTGGLAAVVIGRRRITAAKLQPADRG
jgi:hypothetical protein